jgi:CRISPR/Cas system-associated exonuclease Cas4 (RecB family)
MTSVYKLSPSDLTFLWDECKRCFYLKVVKGYRRPSTPFPKIFSRIDMLMKDYYLDKSTREISPDLSDGKVYLTGRWVESEIIRIPSHAAECFVTGMFDTVLQFHDGSYGVVDFKTTETKDEHIPFYSRQLQAYAYALEHTAPTKLHLSPIKKMGLLCFEPRHMDKDESGRLTYRGSVIWQECPIDEPGFLNLMGDILSVLELPEPPAAGEKCEFCIYREQARLTNL